MYKNGDMVSFRKRLYIWIGFVTALVKNVKKHSIIRSIYDYEIIPGEIPEINLEFVPTNDLEKVSNVISDN